MVNGHFGKHWAAAHCLQRRSAQMSVLQKLSRWGALEADRQAADEQAALESESRQLSMEQAAAAKRQLFLPKESFSMVRPPCLEP